ncbi:head-tail connector protein [Pseudogemmobacter bohemicus]|uniref:head-tail connector protein n=1 Tax=Pseudogemmobacter bohemicus TaxID=2250708 RepID=UPI000DD3BEC9|nr:head-tail connector protein [Pseudogemmobacter bohemicus]
MIVTLDQLKGQIGFTPDMGDIDDALLTRKGEAAQDMIEHRLGFKIVEHFTDGVPPALIEAVLMLAAWWYDTRETAGDNSREVPFGVSMIIDDFRDWSF